MSIPTFGEVAYFGHTVIGLVSQRAATFDTSEESADAGTVVCAVLTVIREQSGVGPLRVELEILLIVHVESEDTFACICRQLEIFDRLAVFVLRHRYVSEQSSYRVKIRPENSILLVVLDLRSSQFDCSLDFLSIVTVIISKRTIVGGCSPWVPALDHVDTVTDFHALEYGLCVMA